MLGGAGITPLATAQNPVILQGNYVSNVFGQSNFILNPNAQTNTANVTNATRSITTPLVATSEFTLNLTNGQFATWTLRPFDSGMKGQNCEARFSYRGFATATSTAQIVQNSLVVAQLVLTPSTDPRIASINFPCGDLVHATTFRIAQTTANMTTVTPNEIGGIYLGLATNQANVAQAEFVGSLAWPNTSTSSSVNATTFTAFSALGTAATPKGSVTSPSNAPKITIPNMKAGNYRIQFTGNFLCFSAIDTDSTCAVRLTDGTTEFGSQSGLRSLGAVGGGNQGETSTTLSFDFEYTGTVASKTFELQGRTNGANTYVRVENNPSGGALQISVYRFPTSSELVVTPERQNVFAAAKWTGGALTSVSTNTTVAVGGSFTGYTPYGKASTTAPASMEMTVTNIPPGAYKATVNLQLVTEVTSAGTMDCYIKLSDDGGSTYQVVQGSTATNQSAQTFAQSIGGTTFFNYTSFQASKTFKVYLEKAIGTGQCRAQAIASNTNIILEPLDQPSNSALYVQGPVLGAQTGAAIPAGYVGETIFNADFSKTNLVNGWNVLRNFTLPVGVWNCNGGVHINRNGATIANPNLVAGFSDLNGAPSTDNFYDFNAGRFTSATSNLFDSFVINLRPMVIRSTGSQIISPFGTASGSTLYIAAYVATISAGTPRAHLDYQCLRLN
jgi:hypothetical protein